MRSPIPREPAAASGHPLTSWPSLDGVVFDPCDEVSCARLVRLAAEHDGMSYIRTTQGATLVIYATEESFEIEGCRVLHPGHQDAVEVMAAGITVHEASAAPDAPRRDSAIVAAVRGLENR